MAPGISFDLLYRNNRDAVYAYVAGMLRDQVAAEEVTAATFERAYRKRNKYDPDRGSARAWLFGIARNAALDELRRLRRHQPLPDEQIDTLARETEHPTERSENRIAVIAALGGLDGREQELVALRFFAGLSNAEIAELLGISESNAGTRLHRIVNKLREACDVA